MRRLWVSAVLSMSLALSACSQGGAQDNGAKGKAGPGGGAGEPLTVGAIDIAPRQVPVSFEAVGRTEGSREVQVRARVAGILQEQLFTEGDTVKAGTPLFRIEREPFEIELAQTRAQLSQETARQELAQQELERLKSLADRRAISQKEADQAASLARQSAAAVQLARARVRQAELNLSYTTVAAPISGITGRAQQSVGALVQPSNESATLTAMTRADPIWVRFALSEAEYARLRTSGEKDISVRVQTADGAPYPQAGKLNFSGSTVDAATGTVQMRAELPNAKQQLLPGQYVRVQVVAGATEAIVVPQSAVLQDQSGRFVWVAADGKAAPRPIRAGSWVGSDWIVLEGLKPGETVIVDNLVRLRPGTPVQIQKKNS